MRDETVGAALVLVASVGFGTLAVFGKFAELTGLGRPTLLVFRFLIGGGVVWTVLAVRGELVLLPPRQVGATAALGVVYGVLTLAYFWGLSFLTASLTSIIFYSYPVYVVVLSGLFLDERLTGRVAAGLALALGGVVLVVGVDTTGADPFGVGLVVLAAVGVAVYIAAGRALSTRASPRVLVAHTLVATTVVIGVRWAVAGAPMPTRAVHWSIVVGIGVVGTGVPLLLLYEGLGRVSANRASVLGTAEPLATVVLGVALLGDPLPPGTILGGVLVVSGVLLVQLDEPVARFVRAVGRS